MDDIIADLDQALTAT
nr:hypothetical protein [Bradyrhizobium japonicum]